MSFKFFSKKKFEINTKIKIRYVFRYLPQSFTTINIEDKKIS